MLTPLDCPEKFYHSILSTIDLATEDDYIHLNYFVIKEDRRGLALLSTLYQALKRKVNIEIIVDSYGSIHPGDDGTEYDGNPLSYEMLNQMQAWGANVKVFHPIKTTNKIALDNLKNWNWFTRRNHNKLFLFNIKALNQKGIIVGDSQWAEEHFTDVFRGNNVFIEDQEIFQQAENYAKKLLTSKHVKNPKKHNLKKILIERLNTQLDNIYESLFIDHNWRRELPIFQSESMEFVFNELDFNNPRERKTIQDRELELIKKAKRFVWYSTPYFGPDHIMQDGFINAEKSNHVELKILIAKFRDHPFLPYGTKRAVSKLIKHGIKIYEYNGNGNIHYKDLLIDDISFIKSANGEGRSRFFNLETGIIIKSQDYVDYNRSHMNLDIKQSIKLHKDTHFIKEKYLLKRMCKHLLCPLYYHHL